MRILFFLLGLLCLGFGVLGIALPLLPTTPFLLLSAFFFARSSEKFHSFLINHPYFGETISNWQEKGTISKNNKTQAMIVIIATLGLSYALNVPTTILIIQICVLCLVSTFILTRPSQ